MHFLNLFGTNTLNNFILQEDWARAGKECELHPNEARMWSTRVGFFDGEHNSHVLPLHQACALRPPGHFVETLIQAYPQSVHCKETSFKRLPIHISCQSSPSVDVVNILLSYYPEGAAVQDVLGRLPLHYACSNGASAEVVASLLAAFPRSASCRDVHGWLPLHVACHFGATPEVVQKLIVAYPDGVRARTEKGSNPMKLLQKIHCKDKEEIRSLLEAEVFHAPPQQPNGTASRSDHSEGIVRRRIHPHPQPA